MPTDAQRRATAKYKREHTRSKTVVFGESDYDLLDWVREQPNQNAYIKSLIRADMERRRGHEA